MGQAQSALRQLAGLVLLGAWVYGCAAPVTREIAVVDPIAPQYSQHHRRNGIEGQVCVQVFVSSSGAVDSTEVLFSSNCVLDRHAVLAARLTKYNPAIEDGVAVDSHIDMVYEFECTRDASGECEFAGPMSFEQRRRVLSVPGFRKCLYGHWLAGDVEVRISEGRVYVDGIRVYPVVPELERISVSGEAKHAAIFEIVRSECELLQRELTVQGQSPADIQARVLELVSGYPGVSSSAVQEDGSVRVEFEWGRSFELAALSDFSKPDIEDREVLEFWARGESEFYSWLNRLSRDGYDFVTARSSRSFRRCGANGQQIENYEADHGFQKNSAGGIDWPDGLGDLDEHDVQLIRRPVWLGRV